jgi:hypothetical protein
MSHVNASALVATFTDYDERCSPYEGRALRLCITADVAFVYVGKLTEDAHGERFEHQDETSVGVDAQALYEALGVMLRRSDRETAERLTEGTLPQDHPSIVTVPTEALALGIRKRA